MQQHHRVDSAAVANSAASGIQCLLVDPGSGVGKYTLPPHSSLTRLRVQRLSGDQG
jgi:hypothetical protein